MQRRLARVLAAAVTAFVASASFAESFEKNGMPCVAEICLGDELGELQKVRWDKAQEKNPFAPNKVFYSANKKLDAAQLQEVGKIFRGDLGAAAPYLADRLFDNDALPLLTKAKAACWDYGLKGTFTTASGNPTTVLIDLAPDQNTTSEHRWTVVGIDRKLPAVLSQVQRAEAHMQLTARYASFGLKKNYPKVDFGTTGSNGGPEFSFRLRLLRSIDARDRLKMHPLCGGSTKVSVD